MVSAKTASANYFKKEFAESEERYLSEGASQEVSREISGSLSKTFKLEGKITKEQFERLVNGQHPKTGKQLIEHSRQKEYTRKDGTLVKPDPHKIGTDLVMSPPKSVTAVALVGKDSRALEAHREAVKETLVEIERFTQANLGNGKRTQTGNLLVVSFEHDSDRPVNGFVAPQLHTHNLILNLTRDEKGQIRSMDTDEIFKAQNYFTAFYRARLGMRLEEKGFELERHKNGSFEIQGVSPELLDRYSPRARQRDELLEKAGLPYTPKAAELAILHSREKKATITETELREQWEAINRMHGNTVEATIAASRERIATGLVTGPNAEAVRGLTREALRHAIDHLSEREAVFDETKLLAETLRFEAGTIQPLDAKRELLGMVKRGELIHVAHHRGTTPQAALTTPEMLKMEQDNIARMLEGRDRFFQRLGKSQDLAAGITAFERETTLKLNDRQRATLEDVTGSRDRILGIQGKAGVGKTTVLSILRKVAENNGFEVKGLTPSNEAAKELRKTGIEVQTLQSFAQSGQVPDSHGKRLYVIDEASLASTFQINRTCSKLGPNDRLLLVGDTDQHLSVEAGAPFELLQKEGMKTSALNLIVRQDNRELREVVEDLAGKRVKQGLEKLQKIRYRSEKGEIRRGIIEIADRQERLREMVRDFGETPGSTLCIAPDNHTRRELNGLLREELKTQGRIKPDDRTLPVLVPENTTASKRKRVMTYDKGAVVRFTQKSKNFESGEYGRVVARDRAKNWLTVEKESGERVTYNPKYLSGVEIFHEETRQMAEGERIQFTANDKNRGIANRGLAVITALDATGIWVRPDGAAQAIRLEGKERAHIDYGYAVTSYSSQCKTIRKTLVHADTDQSATLVNSRTAYVATSRAVSEARHYTNDTEAHIENMARIQMKTSAIMQNRADGRRQSLSEKTLSELEPAEKKPQRTLSQSVAVAPQVKPSLAPAKAVAVVPKVEQIPVQLPTVAVTPQVRQAQASSIAVNQTPVLEVKAAPARQTFKLSRPSLEAWPDARWKLMDNRRMEPEAVRRLDEQHRQGRIFADDAGRIIGLNDNGTAQVYNPETNQTTRHPVDLAEVRETIRYASLLLNAERRAQHQITAFVGVAVDPNQFRTSRLVYHMYGAGTSLILQTPADPNQQRFVPIETSKIYDPLGLVQGTNPAKAQAERMEIALRASTIAQGMAGDCHQYGGDVRSAATTIALREKGYQASVFKVTDHHGSEHVQMQILDSNQVGQGQGKNLMASRELNPEEAQVRGYRIQSGSMEDPQYTRQQEQARQAQQAAAQQQHLQQQNSRQTEGPEISYGLSR